MQFQQQLERVPFFTFQDREHGINREASDAAGYEVPRVVTFILITPHGHRGDPLEFVADEFIARKTTESRAGKYNPEWVAEFVRGLASFREGKEIPRDGVPVLTWERILKSRREQLSRRWPTLEDLAAVPDSALAEIGMDGRVIRDMARAEIQARLDLSPVVKELADAKELIRQQQDQISSLSARLDLMTVGSEDRRPRGRPRSEPVAA